MLMGDRNFCHPTTFEIARDLGLSSSTMVFDSMNVLERCGFILRSRRSIAHLGSRRNLYQRPSCRYTILHLLSEGLIDGYLRPRPFSEPVAQEAQDLIRKGVEDLLGSGLHEYDVAHENVKTEALAQLLQTSSGTDET